MSVISGFLVGWISGSSQKHSKILLGLVQFGCPPELGMIRPYWCPGNYNVADFFSKLLEKGLFTMHAHRFGMNFEETIVGRLTEVHQTVHLKEFTDFPKKDEKDPTAVFTDIHFEKKSVAYEAYHLSHGFCL